MICLSYSISCMRLNFNDKLTQLQYRVGISLHFPQWTSIKLDWAVTFIIHNLSV